MLIGVISLFPDMFNAITNYGVVGKAIKNNLISIKYWNPRDFTLDKYHSVDNYPYGGGSGMVMCTQPLLNSIHEAKNILGKYTKVIYLSPQGKRLNQKNIVKISKNRKIILVCGRYKGIDERLIGKEINEEWSIGDYILSGGELAAMVLIDSISRLIPGVLGNKLSILEDSFFNGLLDYPNYTRPRIILNKCVPKVLISGNHNQIRLWRLKQSLGKTWLKRPDLFNKFIMNKEEKKLFTQFKLEYYNKYNTF